MKLFDIARHADCPICVCAAQQRSGDGEELRTFSGWGETRPQARRKCLMEAQERQAAMWSDDVTTIGASLDEMTDSAIDPRDITLLSEAQYQVRNQWNASVDRPHRHPAHFEPHRPIDWVEGITLSGGASTHIPAAAVYLGYPQALSQGLAEPDSNGLAAGADPVDAVERALLEVLERDAVSIWWYNALPRPSVALNATRLCEAMVDWLRVQNRELALLDLTHDFDVPVVAAVSFNRAGTDISIGFSAGLSTDAAVDGALGEMVQFDLTKRLTEREGGYPSPFLRTIATLDRAAAPFLFPMDDPAPAGRAPLASGALIERFQKRAPATAVFVFASSDVPVARVVAPGLRPIWPRFAPGRLFSVPVQMGWRRLPKRETDLNPIPILY